MRSLLPVLAYQRPTCEFYITDFQANNTGGSLSAPPYLNVDVIKVIPPQGAIKLQEDK